MSEMSYFYNNHTEKTVVNMINRRDKQPLGTWILDDISLTTGRTLKTLTTLSISMSNMVEIRKRRIYNVMYLPFMIIYAIVIRSVYMTDFLLVKINSSTMCAW